MEENRPAGVLSGLSVRKVAVSGGGRRLPRPFSRFSALLCGEIFVKNLPCPIDNENSLYYNPNKPIVLIGISERSVNRDEEQISEAAEKQFPLRTNAVLPGCLYDRAFRRAQFFVRGEPLSSGHAQSGSEFRPGFFRICISDF